MVSRKAMVIYFQSKKVVKEIEKLNLNITYVNEKANYAIAYTDTVNYEKAKKQVQALSGIKKVDDSLADMEHLEFKE
ncbi:MAG: DUF2129 domain-containing protein [Candidatus Izemoplasmatales bacterium]|nr:DUF2129 domain-containing protein [Candidatus Izemoplasmatales bacterium]